MIGALVVTPSYGRVQLQVLLAATWIHDENPPMPGKRKFQMLEMLEMLLGLFRRHLMVSLLQNLEAVLEETSEQRTSVREGLFDESDFSWYICCRS